MKDIKWRIYYYNGDTFDSSMGSPAAAPGFGAVFVRDNRADGDCMIVSGEFSSEKAYFVCLNDEWKAFDSKALLSAVCHRWEEVSGAVEMTWMSGVEFSKMRQKVQSDPDFRDTYVTGEG